MITGQEAYQNHKDMDMDIDSIQKKLCVEVVVKSVFASKLLDRRF